jgi:hypothetical protein
MRLTIIPISISNNIEKYIINIIKDQQNSIDFFLKIDDIVCDNIIKKIKNKFDFDISCNIINSIKSAYVKSNIMINNNKLDRNAKIIINIYSKNKELFEKNKKYENPILHFSEKYNLSPLNLMRFIIKKKYSQKLTKINKKQLTKFDSKMLDFSIEHDEYALIDGNKIMKEAFAFEKDIEKILINLGVKFKTQDQLSEEQIKEFGKAINTPDFLILSDFYINNVKINWIDAKKFYGSCIKFVKNKIKAQTQKYISEFGSGSIIFSLGFNNDLIFDDILIIDYSSFNSI